MSFIEGTWMNLFRFEHVELHLVISESLVSSNETHLILATYAAGK